MLRESASGETQSPSLLIPTDRDALHEPLEFQVRRLIPVEYGLHDVGCEEGNARAAKRIEADTGIQLARMPLRLGHSTALLVPRPGLLVTLFGGRALCSIGCEEILVDIVGDEPRFAILVEIELLHLLECERPASQTPENRNLAAGLIDPPVAI